MFANSCGFVNEPTAKFQFGLNWLTFQLFAKLLQNNNLKKDGFQTSYYIFSCYV